MSPGDLREALRQAKPLVVLDVRSAEEFQAGHIGGAVNVPIATLEAHTAALPQEVEVVTVCSLGGRRSQGAAELLRQRGWHARPLAGGMAAWSDEGE
jgi:rhodanese-related sulfurtransferase